MIFKGTEKRKVRGMAKEIESLGGYIKRYTSYDQTGYHITIASRLRGHSLDVLADGRAKHSTFDPLELEREREVILERYGWGRIALPVSFSIQTVATLFQYHPYGGRLSDLIGHSNRLRGDQMALFLRNGIRPAEMVLVVVGDFEPLRWRIRGEGRLSKNLGPLPKVFLRGMRSRNQWGARSVVSQGNLRKPISKIAFPITGNA